MGVPIRLPRYRGLTLLCRNLNNSNGETQRTLKKDIIKLVVGHYVQDGFSINGKSVSITELSVFLNTPTTSIMKEIARYSTVLASITSPETIRHTQQAVTGLLLQQALSDRSQVKLQADLMVRSQGGVYKPFVSGETNKALKNLMDSSKPLLEVARLLQGPSGTFIQNNIQTNAVLPGNSKEQLIGPTEAMAMLAESDPISLLESLEKQDKLIKSLNHLELPEVNATKQMGNSGTDSSYTPPRLTMRTPTHTDRNEADGEILEAEPELEDLGFDEFV